MPMERRPEPEYMDDHDEARAYAETDFSEVNERFVTRLLDAAASAPENAIALDLGCGPGDIPLRVAQARPSWHVAGFDASLAMLGFARREERQRDPGRRLWWVLGDAKRCPFPNRSFDVVYSNSILHHISEHVSLWQEIRRLLKPGGFIFVRDLYRPATEDAARRIVQQYAADASELLQEEYYRSLLSAYTPDEVRGQLANAGIAGLRVEPVTDRHMDIFGRLP